MTLRTSLLAAALTLASAFASTAQAQTNEVHLGARVSYNTDAEVAGLGVQVGIPIGRRLEFYPSFDNFFVNSGSLLGFNADLKLRVPLETSDWMYLGAGLNFARRSVGDNNNTNTGANVFIGAESLKGRVHPFGEIRVIANDGTNMQFAVGLNFTM